MSSKSNGNSRHVMKRRSNEVVVSLFSLSPQETLERNFTKYIKRRRDSGMVSMYLKYQQASSGNQILSPDTYIIITK
jgi:N-glycosylase/DNA lyase